jgi:hypothetical protein
MEQECERHSISIPTGFDKIDEKCATARCACSMPFWNQLKISEKTTAAKNCAHARPLAVRLLVSRESCTHLTRPIRERKSHDTSHHCDCRTSDYWFMARVGSHHRVPHPFSHSLYSIRGICLGARSAGSRVYSEIEFFGCGSLARAASQ